MNDEWQCRRAVEGLQKRMRWVVDCTWRTRDPQRLAWRNFELTVMDKQIVAMIRKEQRPFTTMSRRAAGR
jgi:hypothetical protein